MVALNIEMFGEFSVCRYPIILEQMLSVCLSVCVYLSLCVCVSGFITTSDVFENCNWKIAPAFTTLCE